MALLPYVHVLSSLLSIICHSLSCYRIAFAFVSPVVSFYLYIWLQMNEWKTFHVKCIAPILSWHFNNQLTCICLCWKPLVSLSHGTVSASNWLWCLDVTPSNWMYHPHTELFLFDEDEDSGGLRKIVSCKIKDKVWLQFLFFCCRLIKKSSCQRQHNLSGCQRSHHRKQSLFFMKTTLKTKFDQL